MSRLTPREQTWLNMCRSNHELKQRCASLQRKIKRLEAHSPSFEAEIEIARLERICEDIAARWQEAEAEVLALRRDLARRIA